MTAIPAEAGNPITEAITEALAAGWPAPAGAGPATHVLLAAGESWATVFYAGGASAEHDLAGTDIAEEIAEDYYENEHQAQLRRFPVPAVPSYLYTVATGALDTATDADALTRAARL